MSTEIFPGDNNAHFERASRITDNLLHDQGLIEKRPLVWAPGFGRSFRDVEMGTYRDPDSAVRKYTGPERP